VEGEMDTDTTMVVLGALFAVSEALSLIPAVKANGVFQFIYVLLKRLAGKEVKV
jgi:hypothetical protein